MNKYFKLIAVLVLLISFIACDKVNDPYPPQETPVANGSLLGSIDSITVTDNLITDDEMSELKAEYYFIEGSPNSVKIVFKWKDGVSDTLRASSNTSTVAFVNVPVQISGVAPNGILRFVYTCNVTQNLNGNGQVFIPAKPVVPLLNVFIEDFTGQQCPNCPRAARVVHALDSINPGRIISTEVHAGAFAVPSTDPCFTNDFRTSTGDELDAFFSATINGSPSGMINRKTGGLSAPYIFYDPQWNAQVTTELTITPKAFIKTHINYDVASRNINITVGAGAFADQTGDYRVAMYLVEDSVISCQIDAAATPSLITNYVHHNMLRGVIFSNWQGENWATDPVGNVKRIKTYSYSLPLNIVAEQAGIITFIYDASTYRIVQVTEHKVME